MKVCLLFWGTFLGVGYQNYANGEIFFLLGNSLSS
jgi:hypothetical protein